MSFNVATPSLSELDTTIESLIAAVITLEDSAWIRTAAGSAEGSVELVPVLSPTVRSDVAAGSAIALASNVDTTLCSVSVAPGAWRARGLVCYRSVGGVTLAASTQGCGSVAASMPLPTQRTLIRYGAAMTDGVDPSYPIADRVFDFRTATVSTTIYLVVNSIFTGGTSLSAYGWLELEQIAARTLA